MTILTKGKLKKITSGKEVEIVLTLSSTVSLDDLNDLKDRGEFFIALGVSQMEVRDYMGEPRRGLQVVANSSGVVESVKKPADETDEEGEQLAIDVETEVQDAEEEVYEDINEESEQTESEDESEIEEAESEEDVEAEAEEESEIEETEEKDPEDPDKPLTFVDEEDKW